MNHEKIIVSVKSQIQRVHIVLFHLYEALEETKLIYDDRNHSWLGMGRGDWEARRNFGEVRRTFCILMEELCIYQTH